MPEKNVKEQFLSAIKDHELTVLLDQGLYRHLRFKNPKDSYYWFDITTWPNFLCISGDMGCYTFSRNEDMFSFFRNDKLIINADYWNEKIEAGTGRIKITEEWSQDLFDKNIRKYVNNYISGLSLSEAKEVWKQVKDELLCCSDEWESVTAIRDFDNKHIDFCDFFEYSCEEYTFHYLWCCYAIVYVIQKYDELNSKP